MVNEFSYFHYSQNNSGGKFIVNDKVCHHVIVEVPKDGVGSIGAEKLADDIAETLGIYFNGVESGIDCSCCGDRWYGDSNKVFYEVVSGDIVEHIIKFAKDRYAWTSPEVMLYRWGSKEPQCFYTKSLPKKDKPYEK